MIHSDIRSANPLLRPSPTRRKLAKTMVRSITDYGLIKANDHILVAVSGGKDSYSLLDLLEEARRKAPFSFRITAVHLDQRQPGYDGQPLKTWLEASRLKHAIISEDTYSQVLQRTPQGQAYCAICSRLRRGILYTHAERMRCNKIALGHHRDDALETLLMNLFYGGKLQAMPAMYRTDDHRFEVIRPLIECAEQEIIVHAKECDYPILPCNLCGSQAGLRREAMADLLHSLEQSHPALRSTMLRAIKNVRPSHLLDPSVGRISVEASIESKSELALNSTSSKSTLVRLRLPEQKPSIVDHVKPS